MSKIYTGVGARKTPEIVLEVFRYLGESLAKEGYVLRSGACEGADVAFEAGCDAANGEKEIYLPWKGYNGSDSPLFTINPQATAIAKLLHPRWDRVDEKGVHYLSRDVCQVTGQSLTEWSEFVVCWTQDGRLIGGTAMAIRVANTNNIRVFNAGTYHTESWTKKTSYSRQKFIDEVMNYAASRNNES